MTLPDDDPLWDAMAALNLAVFRVVVPPLHDRSACPFKRFCNALKPCFLNLFGTHLQGTHMPWTLLLQ